MDFLEIKNEIGKDVYLIVLEDLITMLNEFREKVRKERIDEYEL